MPSLVWLVPTLWHRRLSPASTEFRTPKWIELFPILRLAGAGPRMSNQSIRRNLEYATGRISLRGQTILALFADTELLYQDVDYGLSSVVASARFSLSRASSSRRSPASHKSRSLQSKSEDVLHFTVSLVHTRSIVSPYRLLLLNSLLHRSIIQEFPILKRPI
ncbi:hypothetical protein C8R45DRAFT_1028307 [Mycena sanguinolenta]|nr:hypothetical protein C8R45DRAFT_1028307 [Mycena sanguinolenta]